MAAVTSSDCSCELRLFLCWCQELHFCCLQHIRSQATLIMRQFPYCVHKYFYSTPNTAMRFLGTRVSKIPDKALSPLWRTSSCQVEPQNCAMGTKGCAGDPASAGSRPSGADVAEGLCQVPQVTKQGTIMNIKEPYILMSPLKCQVSGHAELIPAHPSSFFDMFLLFERLTGYFSWWRI